MLQRTLPAGFIAPCLPTKTDRLLDRQIGGLGTASHPIYELGDAPEQCHDARPVAQESARIHPFAENKHGQDTMPKREVGKAGAIAKKRRRSWDYEHTAMIERCLI